MAQHGSGGGADPFSPGSSLDGGRYILDRELGRGGFGTVFLAREEKPLRRPVVIKLPHPSLLQQPGFAERFQAEIGHLASLEHAAIVKIYGAGVEQGLPYAVVQYLPGGDLSRRLHSGAGTIAPPQILDWLPSIAAALDYMHQRGVLHRDIKPDNILFDAQGQAYLSDFGISKAMTDSQDNSQIRTQTGMFVGAPAYVAPEYVDRKFTAACDQYSLGVVLYEALSGKRPHEADTAERLIIKKATEAPVPLDQKVSGLPPSLVAAVMRALATRPEDRFGSCSELARAFAAALPGAVATPRVTNTTTPAIRPSSPVATTLASEPAPRSRRAMMIAAGVLVALLLPLAWWLSQRVQFVEEPSPPPAIADRTETSPLAAPAEITREAASAATPILESPPIDAEPAIGVAGPELDPSALVAETGTPAPVAPSELPARVTVRSNVSDDSVFIDGELVGSTGSSEYEVPAGKPIEVRVTKPGYTSWQETLTLERGASLTLVATLDPQIEAGMLRLASSQALFGCNTSADSSCYADEVRGEVRVLPEFQIDRTEVSVADYQRCVDARACTVQGLDAEAWNGRAQRSRAGSCNWMKSGRGQHPINCISWDQAFAYCKWQDKRLPSEAEWEKAARGSDGRKYPWGNVEYGSAKMAANIADRSARRSQPDWIVAEDYDDGHEATAPVGSFPNGKSPVGALDMIGNVWEWTADLYKASGSERVARGGSFSDAPRNARVSDRVALAPNTRLATGGFRCAR